jgi:hypothetical protein
VSDEPHLLPCPFGKPQEYALHKPRLNQIGGYWVVSCDQCASHGPVCPTETDAINAWNTRSASGDKRLAAMEKVAAMAKYAQCSCTVPIRDSGHMLECWMPDLSDALREPDLQEGS